VGQAIEAARPFAVDVASGTEAAPGRKDPAKLTAFLRAVEAADERLAAPAGAA
jgi:phosphoribosylanthranilate isomerase